MVPRNIEVWQVQEWAVLGHVDPPVYIEGVDYPQFPDLYLSID